MDKIKFKIAEFEILKDKTVRTWKYSEKSYRFVLRTARNTRIEEYFNTYHDTHCQVYRPKGYLTEELNAISGHGSWEIMDSFPPDLLSIDILPINLLTCRFNSDNIELVIEGHYECGKKIEPWDRADYEQVVSDLLADDADESIFGGDVLLLMLITMCCDRAERGLAYSADYTNVQLTRCFYYMDFFENEYLQSHGYSKKFNNDVMRELRDYRNRCNKVKESLKEN